MVDLLKQKRSLVIVGLSFMMLALFTLPTQVFFPQKASAAYEAGRLIDNNVFLDANSMSAGQIQSFLESKGSGLATRSFVLNCLGPTSTERQLYTNAGATCDVPLPASHVIYYASQIYGINPKVTLATLQKEQSLITTSNPTSWQINQAMGYGCPTTGGCGASTFSYQIDNAVWVLRFHYERARGNNSWWTQTPTWTCGVEKHLYKPNLYPGQNVQFFDTNGTHYTTVYIQNAATSSLYCYTPHAYNNPQGLYGRPSFGSTGLYYSGSYNFVSAFEQWFGSTITPWVNLNTPRIMTTNKVTNKINPYTQELDQELPAGLSIKFESKIGDCLRTAHDTYYGFDRCVKIGDLDEFNPTLTNLNSGSSDIRKSLQWTCKIDYVRYELTNQCFNSGTNIRFLQETTVFGEDYIITKRDAENGYTTAFLKDRFDQWIDLFKPRIMTTNRDTHKINPNTQEVVQSISEGQSVKFVSKIGGCLRTETDDTNDLDLCINISDLDEFSPLISDINVGGITETRVAQQWTCKINFLTNAVTNQCFNPGTTITFKKETTVLGSNIIITKRDAESGATTGFLESRFD